MQSESLDKALDAFIQTLDRLDINQQDKVELMINLKSFLSIMSYERNIEILERARLEGIYETNKGVEPNQRRK